MQKRDEIPKEQPESERFMVSMKRVVFDHMEETCRRKGYSRSEILAEAYRRQYMQDPPPDLTIKHPEGLDPNFWRKKEGEK